LSEHHYNEGEKQDEDWAEFKRGDDLHCLIKALVQRWGA